MKASVITTSRREFINVSHMLSDTVDFNGVPFVIKIFGGVNIKKSLAVDAFLYAIEHQSGIFRVPQRDRMRFEKYPSEADTHLVEGQLMRGSMVVNIAFTRNLWEQASFFIDFQRKPAILIIPQNSIKADNNSHCDLKIELQYIGKNGEAFLHEWTIEFTSQRMIENSKIQKIIDRLNGISERRKLKSPRVILP